MRPARAPCVAPLFSRNARLYLLGSVLLSASQSAFQLLRNLYLKEAGFDEAFIGHSLSAASFGALVGALPTALLIARYRTRPLMVLSSIGAAASFVAMASFLSGAGIIVSSVASGLMLTVIQVTSAPFLAANSKPAERTLLLSVNFAVRTGGGVLGSVMGGYLFRLVGALGHDPMTSYRWAMILGTAFAVLAVGPFAIVDERPPEPAENALSLAVLRARKRLYARLVIPSIPLGLGAGLTIPFLNLYFRNVFHQNGEHIGWYFALVQLTMTVGVLLGPRLARRSGLVKTIVVSELASVPFMLVLAYTSSLELAVVAFLARGALMNMAQPLTTALTMDAVPASERALVNAIITVVNLGCWMLTASIGGVLIEAHGFVPPLWTSAVLYVVSAALYWRYFRKVDLGRSPADTTSPGEIHASAPPPPH